MSGLQLLLFSCWCLVLVSSSNIGASRQDINLHSDGGYTNILVAISDAVDENQEIIENLKEYFTDASKVLLRATKNRLYFRNITILVPTHWQTSPSTSQASDKEEFEKARIVVGKVNVAWGDVPYTLQPGGCGEEGDYIHLTPDYLLKDPATDFTHRPAKRLVREFSHLKWGLFDEDIPITDEVSPRFHSDEDTSKFEVIGCVGGFEKTQKDIVTNKPCVYDKIAGNYPPSCIPVPTSTRNLASFLSFEYLDETVEFCNSTGDGITHNKDHNNRQNILCNSTSAWEVMRTLNDFNDSVTRNGESPPDPVFRFVQHQTVTQIPSAPSATTTTSSTTQYPLQESCDQDIVCLCLDVSESMNRENRLDVMSQQAKIYIRMFLRNDTAMGMVSFSTTATVLAEMTVITDAEVTENLAAKVPTTAGGITSIGSGLLKCHELLRGYAGDNIANTRILLLTDGGENTGPFVSKVLPDLVADRILIDTVLYGNTVPSYSIAIETGGKEHTATTGNVFEHLQLFFLEAATGGCPESLKRAIISNSQKPLGPGILSYSDVLYFDITIGVSTKLVFKYDVGEIDVKVTTPQSNPVTITAFPASRVIEAVIEGVVDTQVDYTITKLSDPDRLINVVVSVSSTPLPGITPITITYRVNNGQISFASNTQFVGYVGVFQGLTPVLGLTVEMIMEQPNKVITVISYTDDGTGKDSIPNDGIYTAFVPAHKIYANGYYSLKLEVSGEGFLPTPPFTANRRKRCVNCGLSLGYVSRTATGNPVVVENWVPVNDSTPPQKIFDARVLIAANTSSNIFTIGWTAPGDDLNVGQVASYEFDVGINSSLSSQVNLSTDEILGNVSRYLVPAGRSLELQFNASKINATIFGVEENTNIRTYYFRIRSKDATGNVADWSNPVSASYIDLSRFAATSKTPTTTVTMNSTTTLALSTDMSTTDPHVTAIALGVSFSILLVIVGSTIACCCYKLNRKRKGIFKLTHSQELHSHI